MSKYFFSALMAVAIIGIFACTVAGGIALVMDVGIHPSIAIVGVVFSALVGAWASVALDSDLA